MNRIAGVKKAAFADYFLGEIDMSPHGRFCNVFGPCFAPRPCVTSRKQAEQRGRDAEEAVIADWRSRGFEVLGQRRRTKAGEIDIVVADRETLVFVEVKARKNFREAAYAVGVRQQERLLRAADGLLAENQEWQRANTRFDVALVCQGKILHIEDAIRYN